jgi:uncharacterized protein (TIGR02284 family)
MKTTNEKTVALLNNIIEINNDRIEGYEKAVKETEDDDLKFLFNKMANESRGHRSELISLVVSLGGSPAEGTKTSGKIYRAWMDIKAALSGKDAHTIISSCEFGEDAALEEYEGVLRENELTGKARETVASQRINIQQSHDHIKALRDAVKEG